LTNKNEAPYLLISLSGFYTLQSCNKISSFKSKSLFGKINSTKYVATFKSLSRFALKILISS